MFSDIKRYPAEIHSLFKICTKYIEFAVQKSLIIFNLDFVKNVLSYGGNYVRLSLQLYVHSDIHQFTLAFDHVVARAHLINQKLLICLYKYSLYFHKKTPGQILRQKKRTCTLYLTFLQKLEAGIHSKGMNQTKRI